ncbi:MAG: ATP-binding protein [Phycisphaeraceae bacterium]|nr:ATP-binding protein [Phycisphaeraceae bacterium]
MSLLSQIQVGRRSAPRRCMIHGVQGVGKSSWAASSDRPIFIQTEDGLGEIDCAKFPLALSFGEVMTALHELRTGAHEFRTVVVDSLDWLERLIWQEICVAENVSNIEKIGYQKGYTFALSYWRPFLEALDGLRRERGMTVILTAHTKIEKFQTPEDSAFDRFSPRLHKLAAAVVMEWCDEVFFATYSTASDPKKVRNVTAPERVMRTCEGPTHVAKNRLQMPYELPLEWAAYDYFAHLSQPSPGNTPATGTASAQEREPDHAPEMAAAADGASSPPA